LESYRNKYQPGTSLIYREIDEYGRFQYHTDLSINVVSYDYINELYTIDIRGGDYVQRARVERSILEKECVLNSKIIQSLRGAINE
jgi:hypothetical protein